MVQVLLSQQLVPQLPSQVSPSSTKSFWHKGTQSLSLRLLHPGAQHPSPLRQLVTWTLVQKASQEVAEPFRESAVQLLESLQAVGQFPSQISFSSTTLLPQLGLQSASLLLLHPLGQHPSPFVQVAIEVKTQLASQFPKLPLREFEVQASPSSQVVGQLPSQISPASTTLLEQSGAQSLSLRLLHPVGQHPSPEVQAKMAVCKQSALQVDEEPINTSTVHAFWSSQLVGQSPSQTSPNSSILFPQLGWQSVSEIESQPLGQQLSSSKQAKSGVLIH